LISNYTGINATKATLLHAPASLTAAIPGLFRGRGPGSGYQIGILRAQYYSPFVEPAANHPFVPALDRNPLFALGGIHVKGPPVHNPRVDSFGSSGTGFEARDFVNGVEHRPDRRRLRFGRQINGVPLAEPVDRDCGGMIRRIGKSRQDPGRRGLRYLRLPITC